MKSMRSEYGDDMLIFLLQFLPNCCKLILLFNSIFLTIKTELVILLGIHIISNLFSFLSELMDKRNFIS